jgi:hypothetical protein
MIQRINFLWVLILLGVTSTSWAYGGGGSSSTKACAKPKFSNFAPAANSEVAPGTSFSFTASSNTYANSIQVSVKGQAADIQTEQQGSGDIAVKGNLPASLKGTYARIDISADGKARCKGTGGWLVKITE